MKPKPSNLASNTVPPTPTALASVTLLACALHDARKALGRAFDAAEDCGLEKTKTEIALTLADVSAAADKTDALVAQANDKLRDGATERRPSSPET